MIYGGICQHIVSRADQDGHAGVGSRSFTVMSASCFGPLSGHCCAIPCRAVDDVAHRRQFGHWEGDLMLFKQKLGQTNVTSLVERVSRFTVILKNPNKRTKPVMGKINKAIKDLPLVARRSITFDRGTEFVNWPHLQAEIGTQTWFCDPSSPWQKGTVENTNRRARRWLPRKRDIRKLSDHDMKVICDRLNNTPRKCLGWKTPAEVFREKMLEEMR